MVYREKLPKIKDLRSLASGIKNFPITGLGIVQYAEHLGFDDQTVHFIELFSRNMVFHSRTDFIEHCRLLERLIKEEQHTPKEYLAVAED